MTSKLDLMKWANRYDEKLDQRVRIRAQQILANAQRNIYRNLKTPKAYSPLAASLKIEADQGGGLRVVTYMPYARYVEFGTRVHPPRPFLTPAAESTKLTLP